MVSTDQTTGRQSSEASSDADSPTSEAVPESEAEASAADEAAEAAGPEQKIEELRERVDELEEERDELNDQMLRKAAEFENYRRRMDREKKRRHQSGMLEVVEPILEVLDDFERSIDAAEELQETQDPESAYESLKGGVEMVFRKFRDTLETLGVEPIDAEGNPFDEELHDAMMRQPSDEAEPGTVLQEVRKGYQMGDRVIRHSRVVVAAEPSEEETAEDEA
ncbi:MAG: nucleotide exchange factor GrpE [Bacteroidetes bacterium SW_9_63_38]|nr:MAG: nucleotide exchange factor GrpE [Bacteroidetes bacterium SW_9_63_38]